MRRGARVWPALALALQLPAGCTTGDGRSGRALYAAHCTDCHGPAGRGDGPMAALQDGRVPDLTGLAARNGGVFPSGHVIRAIGRPRELHGRITAMPDFAELLGGRPVRVRGAAGAEIVTTDTVLRLTDYLRSLQAPAATGG